MTAVAQQDAQTAEEVDRAVNALSGRRLAVLTGAGISTDSGIPDYRGTGAPVRAPMSVEQFLASEDARRRYWVGSHLGWRAFSAAAPNPGHTALAALERQGIATGVITQNVDGLHLRAGSRRVVELHGTMRRVFCTHCGQVFDRRDLAQRVEADNPWITIPENVPLGPDGDVLPQSTTGFRIPACTVCGGMLKPDVVFFGEFIPAEKFREAEQLVRASDALVIAGSSLVVNSGIRLLERARRRRLPIVIVNRGQTRGDARATVKIDAGASEVLQALADALPAPAAQRGA
ncbi:MULTISPECIES: Sir2 family NAD-dependent protein deacetylase [unclassified Microbacterium]|uniref:Sir2 family NAD-dependent protein deacetylase n=1 Tax=Microbacterium sp. zg-B185 TaxID=3049070 RepID=UPI00214CE45C|nr:MULTISPECIES: Sir2 family NAD-dependent protein deacetylase [unclassified Microbacterium]MCR2809888.1 NAD-dependent deacetylase [Microbacterium sp. zg.B185]WIM20851.1 Sir2 family NAD-dependent protein deacetylase [Microbacterium sp. zg-B185]